MTPYENEIIGEYQCGFRRIDQPSTTYLAFDKYLKRSGNTIRLNLNYECLFSLYNNDVGFSREKFEPGPGFEPRISSSQTWRSKPLSYLSFHSSPCSNVPFETIDTKLSHF